MGLRPRTWAKNDYYNKDISSGAAETPSFINQSDKLALGYLYLWPRRGAHQLGPKLCFANDEDVVMMLQGRWCKQEIIWCIIVSAMAQGSREALTFFDYTLNAGAWVNRRQLVLSWGASVASQGKDTKVRIECGRASQGALQDVCKHKYWLEQQFQFMD